MPARIAFEYATIRIVPRVEREEFINTGVVLFCRPRRFLAARIVLDPHLLAVFAPDIEVDTIAQQLDFVERICAGGKHAGPIGELPQPERFRWLAAPRSTVIQASPVHCGICDDPQRALDDLAHTMLHRAARS